MRNSNSIRPIITKIKKKTKYELLFSLLSMCLLLLISINDHKSPMVNNEPLNRIAGNFSDL